MAHNIDLSKSLLEQQSVRELLNISTEEVDPKISLENLMKIAQTVIRSELINAGHDENKLLSLRIESIPSDNIESQIEDKLSLEWHQSFHEEETEIKKNEPDEALRFSEKTLETLKLLANRLNEEVISKSPNRKISGLFWNLTGTRSTTRCTCHHSNGLDYYWKNDGTCDIESGSCGATPNPSPIE